MPRINQTEREPEIVEITEKPYELFTNAKYPYMEWFTTSEKENKWITLNYGKEFTISLKGMRTNIVQAGDMAGYKISSSLNPDTLTIAFKVVGRKEPARVLENVRKRYNQSFKQREEAARAAMDLRLKTEANKRGSTTTPSGGPKNHRKPAINGDRG